MKGKYKVSVENNRLHYEFEIKQNITIIRGDSATGKTTLVNMLRQAQKFGASSGIDLICEVPCKILEGENWKLILENAADTIFFIDNGNAFINTVEFAEAVKKAAVDGLITMGISIDKKIKEALRIRKIPVVCIDGRKRDGLCSVNIDDEKAAYEQIEYALKRGHRDFALIALGRDEYVSNKDDNDSTSNRRLKGYEKALRKYGLSLSDTLILTAEPTVEEGRRILDSIMKSGRSVSCVIAMADAICYGVMKRAKEIDLKVPEQLSIIGFDGLDNIFSDIPLTTIKQAASEKGSKAADILFAIINGEKQDDRAFFVDYRLIEGESVRDEYRI